MATFPCSKCGCEDDTALCNYWSARLREMPALCSVCDPKIGKWHGDFPRGPTRPATNSFALTRLDDAMIKLVEANEEMALRSARPQSGASPGSPES
jgi:hypothetical protein